MYENNFPTRRYNLTLNFVKSTLAKMRKFLIWVLKNPLSDLLKLNGYTVTNTNGEDLDLIVHRFKIVRQDIVTAFEIFEHLVSPCCFKGNKSQQTHCKRPTETLVFKSLQK